MATTKTDPEGPYDVLVIGGGITGFSTAWHLHRRGIKNVAIATNPGVPAATAGAAGLITGGQWDNFTRLSHAHGQDFATKLWQFGDEAFDAVTAYCRQHGISYSTRRRLRLIASEPELKEARQAVGELAGAGFSVTLSEPADDHSLGESLRERILAVQDDGPRGGLVDMPALLHSLEQETGAPRLGPVQSIKFEDSILKVTLSSGEVVTAEMAVVGAHLNIGDLLPELSEALVSVADQWSVVDCPRSQTHWEDAGLVFSTNHTYEWGVVADSNQLHLGGGRYMRPLAGIEATDAAPEEKITKHLLGQLEKTFSWGQGAQPRTSHAGLDCRPCDELPIIGPMFGLGRCLVATGFMGTGLTQGFYSGACLAELIETGRSPRLPRRLWPERLRTIEG